MKPVCFVQATLVTESQMIPQAGLRIANGQIQELGPEVRPAPGDDVQDLCGAYLAPGFVDLHVHGGDGADFMDLSLEAFETVARCHARHGTTALTPTSTVARLDQYEQFVACNRALQSRSWSGPRFLGGHLYGPFFREEAKGCHPAGTFLTPSEGDIVLDWLVAGGIRTFTIAAELPGIERFARRAAELGQLVTIGHSYATYAEVRAAVTWGARHVDHLFCAMSDRARLRLTQPFPMRAGLVEATLASTDLTTEVIADGVHLDADLIRVAYELKGPDRLALVTDSMRAVDQPDGFYAFGPKDGGVTVQKRGAAGLDQAGAALASSVVGMDHCVRFVVQACGIPLPEAIRMASLTPARILGLPGEGLRPGAPADLVVLSKALEVESTWVAGDCVYARSAATAATSPSR